MKIPKLFKKKEKIPVCSAVVLAAGSSERMNDDKIFMTLGSKSLLAHTLKALEDSRYVDEIVVVTRMEKVMEVADLCKNNNISKARKVIRGGATRMESALAGVSETRPGAKLIAIHDGARPFVTEDVISRTVYAAQKHMAAAPVIPSTDTLKAVDENGMITGTVDREHTVRIQTPQIFDADLIKGALTKAASIGLSITDDCAAIEMMGVKPYTVEGDVDNIKLTTPQDLILASAIIQKRGM